MSPPLYPSPFKPQTFVCTRFEQWRAPDSHTISYTLTTWPKPWGLNGNIKINNFKTCPSLLPSLHSMSSRQNALQINFPFFIKFYSTHKIPILTDFFPIHIDDWMFFCRESYYVDSMLFGIPVVHGAFFPTTSIKYLLHPRKLMRFSLSLPNNIYPQRIQIPLSI